MYLTDIIGLKQLGDEHKELFQSFRFVSSYSLVLPFSSPNKLFIFFLFFRQLYVAVAINLVSHLSSF